MIIAKNNEEKRSKIWRIVTLGSSALIVIIAIFLVTKLFTSNPLEGTWADEDGRYRLKIENGGNITVAVPDMGKDAGVKMEYTIDKKSKIITIKGDDEKIQEFLELSDKDYVEEEVMNTLDSIRTTFSYSVDQERLTLTEREYGEQMMFVKE